MRQAHQAVQDGHLSKVNQALSSNGLTKKKVRDELLTKHPQAPPPQLPDEDTKFDKSVETILRFITDFYDTVFKNIIAMEIII